ncbi:ABC-2 transporter permease [Enterococcus sp. LJL51]|uniref:ABC-2 transporter permease n=1 Tax=Enterococcus sp. LJL51 TaxID=3416656 RepID=UPI003CEBED4B
MTNLLYKEFRLCAHPTLYVFMLLGCLIIIPSYPYGIVFFFGCLASFITFYNARENHDAFYTALLPVRKKDIVKSKCVLVVIVELGQLLISLPFAYLRTLILPEGNPIGIEANVAYYGFGLIVYAVFNLFFFTEFYKTAYKVGRAFIYGIIPAMIIVVVMESFTYVPGMQWVDSMTPALMLKQAPILIAGIIIYSVFTFLAYKIASKRFERVDL